MPSQVASRALIVVTLLVLAPATRLRSGLSGRRCPGCLRGRVTWRDHRGGQSGAHRKDQNRGDRHRRTIPHRRSPARRYTVTFTLTGFSTVRREGLELSGSLTATIDADMRVGGVEETITVTGETPLVDVQSVQRQWVLDKEIIDTLPTGRTSINVAVLIPGMTLVAPHSAEKGRMWAATPARVQQTLSIHGSRGGDMRRMVDGLSMQSQGHLGQRFRRQQRDDSGSDGRHGGRLRGAVGWRRPHEHHSARRRQHVQRLALRSPARTSICRATTSTTSSGLSAWSRPAPSRAIGKSTRRSAGRSFAIGSGSSHRAASSAVNNYIANSVANLNAGDRNSFAFAPDTSFRGSRDTLWRNVNAALTWQIDAKNKVSLFIDCAGSLQLLSTRVP